MTDKRACSQLPILNFVVLLLLMLAVVGNNEDVLNFFFFDLKFRTVAD